MDTFLWWMSALGMGLGLSWGCAREERQCSLQDSLALYERRIAPLLEDTSPRSCNECHLSGVDLSLFVRDTPCQTMACLVELGLVDLNDPEGSTVLEWIARADPGSDLVTREVVAQEYEAFREWIAYHADCGDRACPSFDEPCREESPDACAWADDPGGKFVDPGDCSNFTLEALFRERVFAWRGRCYPCHFASEDVLTDVAPKWIRDGPCNAASLETMREVERSEYVDLDQPERSLLLLKPLAEGAGGVAHGGHDKFASTQEQAYMDFLEWIERRAACID